MPLSPRPQTVDRPPRRGTRAIVRASLLASMAAMLSAPTLATATDAPRTFAQPEAASGRSPKPVIQARRFLAVTAHPLATDIAFEILEAGGSAVDAAIAAQAALALVEPQSSGLGGGGFLLHHDPASGKVQAYDGRETAPESARPERFLDPTGQPLGFERAVIGGRSVGVPGVMRMLELVHQDHGHLPWASLFTRAIYLAREGFEVSPRLHALIARDQWLRTDPEAAALFYLPDGKPLPIGARLRNPRLADTLEAIAQQGADALHAGAIAAEIVARVRAHPRNPGDLSERDLRDYRALRRSPLCTVHREHLVCGMPPPSSGGIAIAQILAIHGQLEQANAELNGVLRVHQFSEATRLAFADRDRWIGDPEFVRVPVAPLLDARYLKARSALIGPASMDVARPGDPERFLASAAAIQSVETETESTSHLSIVDRAGRTVAFTSSIEQAFGARVMVRGFLLNNQLTDFSFRHRDTDGPLANRVEGGKRPRSSMAPTLVFGRERSAARRLETSARTGVPAPSPTDPNDPAQSTAHAAGHGAVGANAYDVGQRPLLLAIGSPGGPSIIAYVARTLIGVLDDRLPLQQVIDAPNVGSRNGPTELEANTAATALAGALAAWGHRLAIVPMTSGLHGIARRCSDSGEDCILESGTDPRREGLARGR